MAKLEKLCARGVFDPPGYSQIIKVTGAQSLLFLAGQVPYAAGGGVDHPGDFLAQARNVFGAVKAHVEAAGGTLNDVVKITTYVTDIRYRMDFRTVRDEFFGAAGAGLHLHRGRLALAPGLHDRAGGDRGHLRRPAPQRRWSEILTESWRRRSRVRGLSAAANPEGSVLPRASASVILAGSPPEPCVNSCMTSAASA